MTSFNIPSEKFMWCNLCENFNACTDFRFAQVHAELGEEERASVCCALNHEKLSPEALKDLSRNSKFPSETVERALITQQSKIRRLLLENLRGKGCRANPSL
jgi:hypothetical protein